MSHIRFVKTFLFLVFALVPASAVLAQETAIVSPTPGVEKPVDFRTAALKQLGLSREQLQSIKVLNRDRKPLMDAAQARLRLANKSLDEIIYSDNASDTDMQTRLKEFQAAQAEVARIRFTNEFGVRRILTAEQLIRFRQLRQRFEETRMVDRVTPETQNRTVVPRAPIRQMIRQNLKRR